MYFVYILHSESHNRYYIGSTSDLLKRLEAHNSGKTRSTKPFRPWKIIYSETRETNTEARKRENQIKRFKGGVAFKKLINNLPS